MEPKLIIHGGAWNWPDAQDRAKRQGLANVLNTCYTMFELGMSALHVVEAAVRILEDLPMFDAGHGGYLNQQGVVELDALIADGATIDFGAVAGVDRVRNPISLARRVMDSTEQCFVVGEGANQLARKFGLEMESNEELHTPHMVELYEEFKANQNHDTVGAVAIDSNGNLAVGTSTSGSPVKPQGRVGDSPLFGSGGYADNRYGAAGATGKGENIMRLLLSKHACDLMASGRDALNAARDSIHFAEERFELSMCGLLTIDNNGNVGAWHSTPKMAVGYVGADKMPRVGVVAEELFSV